MVSSLTVAVTLVTVWLAYRIHLGVYNIWLHPLSNFPGPNLAAATEWYKTWQEVFLARSWVDVLVELHKIYGDVVRVGPNELHFSSPSAFHDIYNNGNRWDKEESLYCSFGEDRSSFGYLTYKEAKQRKDILAPLFSKRAILELQTLVQNNADRMCQALTVDGRSEKASDLLFALRCFTMDTIINYCFAKDIDACGAENYMAPIVVAMDAALPSFVVFKHFALLRRAVLSMPGWLTRLTNPALAGLVDLQELLGAQVNEVVRNPDLLLKTSHPIIYRRLLDHDLNKSGLPSPGSLYEEAQALLFGGADSAANTLMVGTFHLLRNDKICHRLVDELHRAWPLLGCAAKIEDLERLPFLNAVIKESLRIAPGVPSPLPRMVPSTGAKIGGHAVPADTVAGMSSHFVHKSANIFSHPNDFEPERWLQPNSPDLEKHLVAFSRGPRACLGQNLGMCELYLGFANLFRRFDVELDPGGKEMKEVAWRDCFLPSFTGRHVHVMCRAKAT